MEIFTLTNRATQQKCGCRNVQKRQSIQTVVRAATETEAKPEVAKVGVDY